MLNAPKGNRNKLFAGAAQTNRTLADLDLQVAAGVVAFSDDVDSLIAPHLKCIAHPGFLTSAFVARKIQYCSFKVCIYPNSNSTYGIASFIYVSSCFTIYLYDVLLYTMFPINAARVPMCPQIRHGERQFAGDESRKRVIFEITAAVL